MCLRQLFRNSVLAYGSGFALWVIDKNFCDQLRSARSCVGFVLAPLFQFHAHWHFLAGLGTYLLCVAIQVIRYDHKGHLQTAGNTFSRLQLSFPTPPALPPLTCPLPSQRASQYRQLPPPFLIFRSSSILFWPASFWRGLMWRKGFSLVLYWPRSVQAAYLASSINIS